MEIIHTKTQEEFNRLLRDCKDKIEYIINYSWETYKEETCINLECGREKGGFCDRDWYNYNYPDVKIQTVDEYLNEVDLEAENKYYEGFGYTGIGKPVDLVWDEYETWDLFNKPKNKTMEIVKFAKNLTLSKNEKLMRKQGLKDENGIYTDAYTEIVDNLVYSEYEAKVLEIAKKADEDEKK